MKCTGCGFESEDANVFMAHLIDCESKPEEKWISYLEYGIEPPSFKHSDNLKEEIK